VVPAQFVESQRLQQQREPERPAAAADVPLDAIDLIAAGGSLDGADPRLGREQDEEEQGLEYDSEEVLAAARAALGLDSVELQRLVDDAAAKAAQAMSVPFMSSNSDTAPAGTATSAYKPTTSSGSRKPWEAASPAPDSPAAPTHGGVTQAASKGFAPPAQQVSRKQAKAMRKEGPPSSSGSPERDGRAGKAAAAGSSTAGSALGVDAAAASQVESPEAEPPQSSSTAPGGTTLPPVEQFVLSKAQLKTVTEKHGLDFEELLTGLQERGIPLSD
jgi:hypothetical protein